jgi:tetratricopeptide (TPR) repeat protein
VTRESIFERPGRGGLSLKTLIVGLVFLVLSGCAYQQRDWSFDRELLDADAMTDDGRYGEARTAYEGLAWRSERQDLLAYIRYRLAYLHELEGDAAAAIAAYEQVWRDPVDVYDDRAAQALYRTGRVQRDMLDDEQAALDTWAQLIRMFPNTNFAEDGLFELLRHARRTDAEAEFLPWLQSVSVELARSEIGDNLFFEWARILDDDLDRCEEAMPIWEGIMTTYTRGGLWDDSIWRTGECLRDAGRIDDEYEVLLSFVDGREVSFVAADYDSEYYGDAIDRMATIHEDREEWIAAIAMWERYLRIFPLSLRADDLNWRIMELSVNIGDTERIQRSVDRLREDYPESRWVDDAEELCAQQRGCR